MEAGVSRYGRKQNDLISAPHCALVAGEGAVANARYDVDILITIAIVRRHSRRARAELLALSAIMQLRRAGLSVPNDISIIGSSNSVMAQYVDPPLTTIHLPFRKMDEFAAQQLLGRS